MPLELSDFGAWIECGGTEVECYAVEYSDDRKAVTCWIASEVGKQFDVLWSRDSESQSHTKDLGGQVLIDGVTCADEDAFMDMQCSANLGDIVLEIWQVTIASRSNAPYIYRNPFGEPKIHEKAKKAVDHKVILGEETQIQGKLTTRTATWDQKLVKFTFKYRPIEVLRANDILPRPEMDLGLVPGLENVQASPGQTPEYGNTPGTVNIKQENQEDVRDAATAIDVEAVHVKVEPPLQVVVMSTIMDNDDSEDEDATRMRALKEELYELEKKAEIKALKKRLAELEGNGAPSGHGPQGPAKRAKREPSVAGFTGGSSRSVKTESSTIDLT
ncbi:hypothetical protein FIBSPDRAFT_1046660 [Athelia psychrophila]|uniref:DUF7918 domain-containing protein n=1 Tax=Athelia psychrophila TaxID=1759441 RepID=A0A166GAP8_9AGAM|nr:hypothetical protein FIBSPDRAFT_1046660 [Fibularhizoctonia sp. CBS 109695]